MKDKLGRNITYMRISVTDRCNYRCLYCMGKEGICKAGHGDILSLEEIVEVARIAVGLGVDKIRLTGGEPLVRKGIVSLVRQLKQLDGLQELTLTTNGSLLPTMAQELKDAGLDRLNISIDSLQAEKFRTITRTGDFQDVLDGLRAAENAGFTHTKLNAVLMGGVNDDEIADFVALTKDRDISVRFIELMPMGECADWPKERFISSEAVLEAVPALQEVGGDGVAQTYQVPGYRGTVGLIHPLSRRFCHKCNRIRLTADGKLKPCLHSDEEIPLRGLHGEALEATIRRAILEKPACHAMDATHASETHRAMHQIGG